MVRAPEAARCGEIMAGDWIPARIDLHEDPSVIGISRILKINEDETSGKLLRIWAWASRQTANGVVPYVTTDWLNRFVGLEGFAEAMETVGWLVVRETRLEFPNYHRWMSRSAKERLLSNNRQSNIRLNRDKTVTTVQKSTEEKRREELEDPPTPQSQKQPTAQAEDGPRNSFDAFWAKYPRHVGKVAALKAWQRIEPSTELCQRISEAIARQKESDQWARDDGKFIPHASTWLNGRRWEDDVIAASSNSFQDRLAAAIKREEEKQLASNNGQPPTQPSSI